MSKRTRKQRREAREETRPEVIEKAFQDAMRDRYRATPETRDAFGRTPATPLEISKVISRRIEG